MSFTKVDILETLHQRLLQASEGGLERALIYGLSYGYGGLSHPVALTIVNYSGEESLKAATETLPFGMSLLGIVECENDEDQEFYSTMDVLDYPILFKVVQDELLVSTGLDFKHLIDCNVISAASFWEKSVCSFRIRGHLLISSLLELPDLKDCFTLAKSRIINQAAFVVGKSGPTATILPRDGHLVSESPHLKKKGSVGDLLRIVKPDLDESRLKNQTYFRPELSLIHVQILSDLTKCNSFKKSPVLISDKTPRVKTFEHYIEIDALCVTPMSMLAINLYRKFNAAICSQLEAAHDNILHQLGNSISANKPVAHHFWPNFSQHFLTVIYPENISDEKLVSRRETLHKLYFIREIRPVFRRTMSISSSSPYLISPHVSIKGKWPETTTTITGHYEYRHYMQDGFNDEGWGCAYRSLQTLSSWFLFQGYTQCSVPTHKEIQECLVSLGDKPASFVGSKKWIGSTEVGYVLEALLGVSCRILNLSSGAELTSRASDLESHFRNYGTPVMIGGGVLAHTIIGVSRNPENDDDVQYLVVDPHYNGKEDMKTILNKGWVGWKDVKFWSKSDFYNLCLPLLPSTI